MIMYVTLNCSFLSFIFAYAFIYFILIPIENENKVWSRTSQVAIMIQNDQVWLRKTIQNDQVCYAWLLVLILHICLLNDPEWSGMLRLTARSYPSSLPTHSSLFFCLLTACSEWSFPSRTRTRTERSRMIRYVTLNCLFLSFIFAYS